MSFVNAEGRRFLVFSPWYNLWELSICMIKKILNGGLLSLSILALSGCTLKPPAIGDPSLGKGNNTAFETKAEAGSVWRSDDGGKTFAPKVYVDEKRKVTKADVLNISFQLRDDSVAKGEEIRRVPDIYIGTVDDMIFKTADGAETWQPVNFPPQKVYSFVASRRSVDRMYATGVLANRGKIFRTTDGGVTWQDVYSEPGAGTTIVSLAEHPMDINLLYAGTSTGTVVMSRDGGDTWKNVGMAVNGPITEIVFDAKEKNQLYLLAFNSKIYTSSDAGETWLDWDKVRADERKKDPNAPAPKVASIPTQGLSTIVADPYISGTLYAGTSAGLYRSRDFGKNLEKLNIIESAEKFPIRAFAVNPKNSQEIVFVAGRTFYKSLNAGETWSVSMLNTDREVSVLAYDPIYPEVIYLGLRKIK